MDLKETFFAVTGRGKSPQLGQQLFKAIRNWDAVEVDRLLAAGADPNVRDPYFAQTPLFAAAEHGHNDMAAALLAQGARADVTDKMGRTPLLLACSLGDPTTFKLLMEHHADPLAGDEKCRTRLLLHATVRGYADVLAPLLNAGAATHAPDKEGNTLETLLQLAAEWGQPESVKLLLEAGARIDTPDAKGRLPLELAVTGNDPECIHLIVAQGGDLTQGTKAGISLLRAAIVGKHTESAKALLDAGCDVHERDKYDSTLLHEAAEAGCVENVELLLKNGADFTLQDQYKRTALWTAVIHRQASCTEALLNAGADPNDKYSDREALLTYAVCFGDTAIAKALIAAGADIHSVDADGRSLLRTALRFSNGKADMVKVVLDAGADTRHESEGDKKGDDVTDKEYAQTRCAEVRDAVNEAAKKFDILDAAAAGDAALVKQLLADGVPVDTKGRDGKTALYLACENGHGDAARALLACKADPMIVPEGSRSMLFLAVCARGADAVAALCAAGVAANEVESGKDTPLSMACSNGDVVTVKALLRGGANANLEDGFGWRPIFAAVHSQCAETVEAIVDGGATVHFAMSDGHTPIDLATQKGGEEMVRFLKRSREQEIEHMATSATCLSQKVSPLKTLRFKPGA